MSAVLCPQWNSGCLPHSNRDSNCVSNRPQLPVAYGKGGTFEPHFFAPDFITNPINAKTSEVRGHLGSPGLSPSILQPQLGADSSMPSHARLRRSTTAPLARPTGEEGGKNERTERSKERDAIGHLEALHGLAASLVEEADDLLLCCSGLKRRHRRERSLGTRRDVVLRGDTWRLADAEARGRHRRGVFQLLLLRLDLRRQSRR